MNDEPATVPSVSSICVHPTDQAPHAQYHAGQNFEKPNAWNLNAVEAARCQALVFDQVLALRLPGEEGRRSMGKDDTQSLAFFDVEVEHRNDL